MLEVNGHPVANANDLRMNISMMRPGTTVHIKVVRDGVTRDFTAQLGDPRGTQASNRGPGAKSSHSALGGVSVDNWMRKPRASCICPPARPTWW